MILNISEAMNNFARSVRNSRESKKLTQAELAEKLNMNAHTIMDIEMGRSNPRIETVLLIAAELDMSLDSVISDTFSQSIPLSVEVIEFFAGKTMERARLYIKLCREAERIAALKESEK